MGKIIKVDMLQKKYGQLIAVDNISFEVEQGEMFAFLGPNGAGKSTTINILCSILSKNAGKVIIDGFETGKQDSDIRKLIGVVFQDSVLDGLLSVQENLETRGAFYGLKGAVLKNRIVEVADAVNITEILKRPYGKLSGGQRRRADIARALINTPKILFLDEPTTGLDPQTRVSVWETIRNLQKEKGVTIFLTTHYMEEAAGADDVAIIDHGNIVVRGTPADLRVRYSLDQLRIIPNNNEQFIEFASRRGLQIKPGPGMFTINIENSMQGLQILKDAEPLIQNFEVIRGNMDDVFINITGKELRSEEVQ
ncbi:MAG: ATP-binding cassette domain-containing protein [Syntrophomonas sp.]|nr:ATP-binding cassette domain-containing protein [Syntrophomonas sp.]